ncbi:Ig-like domain-containing protein [Elstera litoralis]|uniref:Ig-like domain-containing protein n=1 Tax=Elstera litoralis TaxID=552518 RepID=UPI0006984E6D|nr:Ig-like domain-containing protein [Elstera litoralis]
MRWLATTRLGLTLLAFSAGGFALAQTPAAPVALDPSAIIPAVPLDHTQRADGAVLVPDRFLRRWDSLTLFLDQDQGPKTPAAEDQPGRFVDLNPPQPGAWQWINPRTLHFKPAEPWPAGQGVTVRIGARSERLTVLMPAPVAVIPADGATQVPRPQEILLSFSEPVAPDLLARLLTVEIRPYPGVDAGQGRSLTGQDFTVKPLDRAGAGAPARYAIQFRSPIEDGAKVFVRLRQALDASLDAPVSSSSFATAQAFRATALTCGRGYDGGSTDGALQCQPTRYRDADSGPAVPGLRLTFSAGVPTLDPVQAANLLRISPPIDGLKAAPDGTNALRLTGAFRPDTLYELRLGDAGVTDSDGRALDAAASPAWKFFFSPERALLAWEESQGIVERLGPQMVPIRARGVDKLDLRIHPIDPLSRDFWPFPDAAVTVDEDQEPPLAGLEPEPTDQVEPITPKLLAERLKALGTPSISEIITLPGKRGGGLARLGVDLQLSQPNCRAGAPWCLSGRHSPHRRPGAAQLDADSSDRSCALGSGRGGGGAVLRDLAGDRPAGCGGADSDRGRLGPTRSGFRPRYYGRDGFLRLGRPRRRKSALVSADGEQRRRPADLPPQSRGAALRRADLEQHQPRLAGLGAAPPGAASGNRPPALPCFRRTPDLSPGRSGAIQGLRANLSRRRASFRLGHGVARGARAE